MQNVCFTVFMTRTDFAGSKHFIFLLISNLRNDLILLVIQKPRFLIHVNLFERFGESESRRD